MTLPASDQHQPSAAAIIHFIWHTIYRCDGGATDVSDGPWDRKSHNMSFANSHLEKNRSPKGEIHTDGAMGNKRTTERVMDNLSHRARILEKSSGGGMAEVPTCRRQSWS